MKPAWAQVKLRVAFGDIPEAGTELRMRTGRRYLVVGVRGKTLTCLVLPPDEPVDGPVWDWQWASKKRKPKWPPMR